MNDARGFGFTQRDAVVLAVITLVLAPVLIVVIRESNERSRRTRCADNLKAIGLALLLYSNENRGSAPRVRYAPAKVVNPVWGTGATSSDPFAGPEPHDVTAAMFLLLRTQDLTAARFVCPATDAIPDAFGGGQNTAKDRANFTDLRKNLSYSMQNPYLDEWGRMRTYRTLGSIAADFAVGADMNPGVSGVGDDVTKPNTSSSAESMKLANSNNHGGEGQNVLYSDGRVEFRGTPFAGFRNDNVFTNYLGEVVASPRKEFEDTVLLPTDD